MNGIVCLVPSKGGQCTLLAGHTGYPHRSPSGFEWEEDLTWSIKEKKNIEPAQETVVIDVEERLKMDPVQQELLYGTVYKEIVHPVKRGRGRPRKWFKDAQGKWYKNE